MGLVLRQHLQQRRHFAAAVLCFVIITQTMLMIYQNAFLPSTYYLTTSSTQPGQYGYQTKQKANITF